MLPGNFAGSTLLTLSADDPPPTSLALVAGLALHDVVAPLAPEAAAVNLKWPNDLMMDGAKLAGILIERAGSRLVVGFGVNLAQAPVVDGREIASLNGDTGPERFADLLAKSFAARRDQWRTDGAEATIDAWLDRAHPIGSAVRVHDGTTLVEGGFGGLDRDGAMILLLPDGGVARIYSGDVELAPLANRAGQD